MSTISQNFSSNQKLVNFNVPHYLIKNFDTFVKFKGVSRTSMLIHLMESYLRVEMKKMETDKELNQLIGTIEDRSINTFKRELKRIIEDDEPPMIPNSTDHWVLDETYDWESRLGEL